MDTMTTETNEIIAFKAERAWEVFYDRLGSTFELDFPEFFEAFDGEPEDAELVSRLEAEGWDLG